MERMACVKVINVALQLLSENIVLRDCNSVLVGELVSQRQACVHIIMLYTCFKPYFETASTDPVCVCVRVCVYVCVYVYLSTCARTRARGCTRIVQKSQPLSHHCLDQGTASAQDEMLGLVPDDVELHHSFYAANLSEANVCGWGTRRLGTNH